MAASFHILPNLFSNNPTIWQYKIYATDIID